MRSPGSTVRDRVSTASPPATATDSTWTAAAPVEEFAATTKSPGAGTEPLVQCSVETQRQDRPDTVAL